jgi:hypothetical protein
MWVPGFDPDRIMITVRCLVEEHWWIVMEYFTRCLRYGVGEFVVCDVIRC